MVCVPCTCKSPTRGLSPWRDQHPNSLSLGTGARRPAYQGQLLLQSHLRERGLRPVIGGSGRQSSESRASTDCRWQEQQKPSQPHDAQPCDKRNRFHVALEEHQVTDSGASLGYFFGSRGKCSVREGQVRPPAPSFGGDGALSVVSVNNHQKLRFCTPRTQDNEEGCRGARWGWRPRSSSPTSLAFVDRRKRPQQTIYWLSLPSSFVAGERACLEKALPNRVRRRVQIASSPSV